MHDVLSAVVQNIFLLLEYKEPSKISLLSLILPPSLHQSCPIAIPQA